MDFEDRPEQAAFRRQVREFLTEHAKLKSDAIAVSAMSHQAGSPEEAEQIRASKEWQATLFDHGWAGISWPTEYGGRGGTMVEQLIFNQELGDFDVPANIFVQGIAMAGPTILAHGSHAQKERFLRPMLRGDEVWCQLFSEPNAGSDLAALRTRAELDGDEYVVNGQKVWTSSAHFSDWGILLARTDPDAPKHRGITYFLVDMRSPGIEVRPLRQITGIAHFNEVFLDDVRIPVDQVVGGENAGWAAAMTTLTNERTMIGSTGHDLVTPLQRLIHRFGRASDPLVRSEFVRCYITQELLKFLGWRVQTSILRGEQPGPESSVLKLVNGDLNERAANLGVSVAGADGLLNQANDAELAEMTNTFLGQFVSRIGGGTDNIQRNIIAERVLGLPGEPRTDKNAPFRELPN